MTAEESAPGVIKFGPFGPYHNAVWLFTNGGEAAVCEMPPYKGGESRPWSRLKQELEWRGLRLKYAMLSHAHIDHCESLIAFRHSFGEAEFVAHRSQYESKLVRRLCGQAGYTPGVVFDRVFDGEIQLLELGGEMLILLHCPKHSPSDVFVIFRGTALTGDWYLGDLRDCNALVSPQRKIHSVERVQEWLRRLEYRVSRAFSAHGDCLYYDVDFDALLERSKALHELATV